MYVFFATTPFIQSDLRTPGPTVELIKSAYHATELKTSLQLGLGRDKQEKVSGSNPVQR